jgi:hypothetical protein
VKIGILRQVPRHVLDGVAFIYAYGALLGACLLGWSVIAGNNKPKLEWWEWLAAPLAVGITALMLEALWEFLSNGFSVRPSDSKMRTALGNLAVVILLLLLVIGWPILQMSRS